MKSASAISPSKNGERVTRTYAETGRLLRRGLMPAPGVFTTLLLALSINACGGGGGSGGGSEPPPPDPMPPPPPPPSPLAHCEGEESGTFVNVTTELGLCYDAGEGEILDGGEQARANGGLAFSDIDRDGALELYVAHGDRSTGRLFRFDGDQFARIEGSNGIQPSGLDKAGYFVDLDADGWPDFVSVQASSLEVLLNDQSGNFNVFTDSGITHDRRTHSMAAADIDLDDDLDLFFTHFGDAWPTSRSQYLWRNLGSGQFADESDRVPLVPGVSPEDSSESEALYSAAFVDIQADGYPDLLVTGNQGATRVLENRQGDAFSDVTGETVSHEFGRGAAFGDYDLDGDIDWFVSGVFESGNSERDGNRLYRNNGSGMFEDVSTAAGVAEGGSAWGSCFADFDNDQNLDLFVVHGAPEASDTTHVPSHLYMSNGDGTFTERAAELGIDHSAEGRGLVCTDYDADGLMDIFIANQGNSPKVYRNNHENSNHYLSVRLIASGGNRDAIGARVRITSASGNQVRELKLGAGYLSQAPAILHFGLGTDDVVRRIEVEWPGPDMRVSELLDVQADQRITIEKPEVERLGLVVVRGSGRGLYLPGEEVYVEAGEGPEGTSFSHWSSSGGGQFADRLSTNTTFTMPEEAVTIRANFLPGPRFGDADISVARMWNEVLLDAIRNDFARPVVHARNLFHVSAAMYDAWAAYQPTASTYYYGKNLNQIPCDSAPATRNVENTTRAQEISLSYAAYRLIRHRFEDSPGRIAIAENARTLMSAVEVDPGIDLTDFESIATDEDYAAWIGNHIADCYISFGLEDGANEANDYENQSYLPVNPALEPHLPGNPNILDLDRWQPLRLREFIDQAGNPSDSEPAFIGAEWGSVHAFALSELDLDIYSRNNFDYWVYHDPGPPPSIEGPLSETYKWAFSLVAVWASHLSPDDAVDIDISPRSIGNIRDYPDSFTDYPAFYSDQGGISTSLGYEMNPVTGQPYDAQIVPRGDYTRVLAEFWADGPDSETPPGHWFVIANTVHDHPEFERDFKGLGDILEPLEWDIKAYFALGGAMHDAAIAAWGAKGWYDYVRPISALRAMADRGQSSDASLPSYHETGIPLKQGYVELVMESDSLEGEENEHVGKIKFKSWRGPDFIEDPREDAAGVDWILAENWWPYQRPTFVTPPFAGYVSGHSTYSRAAAEVLTALTGNAFFPGGKSGFEIEANSFLVFERGPSVDLTLEWATYRDAADQSALSRIWGGIHPPIDDIPGRLMGRRVGEDAFRLAEEYFDGVR